MGISAKAGGGTIVPFFPDANPSVYRSARTGEDPKTDTHHVRPVTPNYPKHLRLPATTMSDLLPLVTEVLRDRAALDAQEELRALQLQLQTARAVEVIGVRQDDGAFVVYASGQFTEGKYDHNPNLFQVDLQTMAPCRLADLRTCRICVGGGFPLESLDDQEANRAPLDGFFPTLTPDESRNHAKPVQFCFSPNATWLSIVVHDWPLDLFRLTVQDNVVDAEDVIDFLVETVAVRHPEATVEFVDFTMPNTHIPAAVQRLLPPARLTEVQAERAERLADEDRENGDALLRFVARAMRDAGNINPEALFMPQVEEILENLERLDIFHVDDENEEIITRIVGLYQRQPDTLSNVIEQILQRRQNEQAVDDQIEE